MLELIKMTKNWLMIFDTLFIKNEMKLIRHYILNRKYY